ncbi:hypothetical protein TEA_000827 [Camellia sinensis var. sinensis]|uniref:Crossover junction endonuclease MUS81 n=1 Tax=Camellia sinensis var. sinensis TaxID=542762 RepID=A0A4S4DR86_CAMSN|nr:hypothetical protein TEA_000827 [Camellia sinensis var. sinensis]
MEKQRRVVCPENDNLAEFMWKKRQEMAERPKGILENIEMTLHKAYSNVCNSKSPIRTLKDFSQIKGVGKWILRLMQEYFGTDSGASEQEDITKKGKKSKGTKRYVPQKNSVAYALLLSLYRGTASGSDFMRKQELIDAAEASGLSRVPIMPEKVKGKPGQFGSSPKDWYSGWSCMKTLITKGLVVKSSCPAKLVLSLPNIAHIRVMLMPCICAIAAHTLAKGCVLVPQHFVNFSPCCLGMPPSCHGLGWTLAQGVANANHAAFKQKFEATSKDYGATTKEDVAMLKGDASMLKSDVRTITTTFEEMKVLMKRYMLTEEGKEAARECLLRTGLVDLTENWTTTERLSNLDASNISDLEFARADMAKEVTLGSVNSSSQKKLIDVPLESLDRFLRMGYSKEQILCAFTEVSETSQNKEISSLWPAVLCHLREEQVYGLPLESHKTLREDCLASSNTSKSRDGQVDLSVIENSQMESNCSGALHITNSSCLPAGSSFTLRACSSTESFLDTWHVIVGAGPSTTWPAKVH